MAEGKLRVSATDILLQCLEELESYDFKRFRFYLMDYPFKEDYTKIPKGRLEDTDRLRIVDEMISHYKEEYALEITAHLLDKINQKGLSDKCKEDTRKWLMNNQHLQRSNYEDQKKYMDFIVRKFRVMQENVSLMGEHIILKDWYTRLLIVKDPCDQEEREHEIISTGKKHQEIFDQRAEFSYSSIADLFEPDAYGDVPRIVILQGPAGIGKTMIARKIILDWASGELFQDKFNYVFYINSREINQSSAERTIADLIHSYPGISLSCIETEPEKLLFIIDGFDELKLPRDIQLAVPGKTSIMDCTVLNLISPKCLLPTNILITTRPTALEKLRKCVEVPRFAEILGFSDEDRKKYFMKFFRDETQGMVAFNAVKENEILFTMCFVPIVCWIVCTVIKERLKKSGDSVCTLKSTTSLYMSFLANLLNHHVRANTEINMHLKSLCALANEGVLQQKILFEESDIINYGLNIKDMQSLFLTNNIFIKDAQYNMLYSFIHLSFQEFFAALFYILVETTGDQQERIERLLEAYKKEGHGHLMLTVRFLFGLLNEELMRKMRNIFKWKVSAAIKCFLKKWVNKEIGNIIKYKPLDLLCCLYENQDEEFAKEALQSLEHVFLEHKINDWSSYPSRVVTFCIKNAPPIKTLQLSFFALKPEGVRMLLPCLGECSNLKLVDCLLTSSSCTDLSFYFQANSSLKELELSSNSLEESGMRQLCKGLKEPNCKIQRLTLECCFLTASCCADLSSLLQTNSSIFELNLSLNKLEDSGVRQLCEGLKHSNCKLQKLKLEFCSVTPSYCADLSSLLQTNSSIIYLSLGCNTLDCSGMRELYEGLKQSSFELQVLE